jgi:putative glycosyltransferase (TIGR04372 family)
VKNSITEHELAELRAVLSSGLINPDDPYCILAIRDGNYYGDESSMRNSKVDSWVPAIESLLERGVAVVRMGRKAASPLPITHPNLCDYSFSQAINPRLDLLLFANASFAIGDSTGLLDAPFLLGCPAMCVSYPFDPRSFISDTDFYFATQTLRLNATGATLKATDVVSIMNTGVNLGDERTLDRLGLSSVIPSAFEIRESVEWFLSIVQDDDDAARASALRVQRLLLQILQEGDHGSAIHYRLDAPRPSDWRNFASTIYPGTVNKLI